ncbi:MAG: M28 family peptidase [Sulfolobales archaeon]
MDAIAGSEVELRDVNEVRAGLEELGFDVRLHSVDVISWIHGECYVNGIKCVPIPPTMGGDIEGVLTQDIESCSDKILIASTTSFPDNIWNIYNMAFERGAKAVIFYDYYPSRFRKIVVSGVWSYGYNHRSSPGIPAVHIRLEDGVRLARRMIGKKIQISSVARIRSSRGISVEGLIGGRRQGSILVAAHHDRWFNSYRDNMIAVKTLMEIAIQISRTGRALHDIRLVSFTAEEFGDPNMPAWYWGYGSRVYAREIDAGEILLAIIIDTAFRKPIRVSTTSPDHLIALLEGVPLDTRLEGYGHPYTDAPSLWRVGIPTITLHNLEDLYPIYHTDLDIEDQQPGFTKILGRELYIGLKNLEPTEVKGERILEDLRERLPYEIFREIERSLNRDSAYELIRCINKHTMKPIYLGSYRELYKDTQVDPFPYSIAYRASLEGVREEIRIPGEELVLYSGEGERESGKIYEALKAAAEEIRLCIKG